MSDSFSLVSIIIPVFNSEAYIKRCIESIINQTYKNIELLLIDDGSTDTSGEICDSYSKKNKNIRVIHQDNRGVNYARYLGVQKACGDWGFFVDADDEVPSNAIESLLNASYKYDIVSGTILIHNQSGKTFPSPPQIKETGEYNGEEFVKSILLGNRHCSLWRQLIKMSVLKKHFLLLPREIKIAEDFLLNINIGLHINHIKGIPNLVYHYYINPTGAFRTKNTDPDYEDMLDKNLEQILLGKTEFEEALFRHRMGIIYWYITFEGITHSVVVQKALAVKSKYKTSTNEKVLLFLCKINNSFLRKQTWEIYSRIRNKIANYKRRLSFKSFI